MNNLQTIFQEMEESAKSDIEQSPSWWIAKATNLHVLFAGQYKQYFVLKKKVAEKKAELLRDPEMTSSKAKALVEAMPEYWEAEQLKSQKKYVDDLIMLAKKMATMTSDEFKGY